MWGGVIIGFAGKKFSGSDKKYGLRRTRLENINKHRKTPSKSFHLKYGWNGILSRFNGVPMGFDEPVSWRNRMWTTIKATRIKGSKKWRAKNRLKVALSTLNPPQIHKVRELPIYGIADKRLVITVAPQKDICPQGRTYPRNAVPIKSSKIKIPLNQVDIKW